VRTLLGEEFERKAITRYKCYWYGARTRPRWLRLEEFRPHQYLERSNAARNGTAVAMRGGRCGHSIESRNTELMLLLSSSEREHDAKDLIEGWILGRRLPDRQPFSLKVLFARIRAHNWKGVGQYPNPFHAEVT